MKEQLESAIKGLEEMRISFKTKKENLVIEIYELQKRLGSLEEDTGSYNKREQKRRKKKKINSCGPTAFQVKRCFLKHFFLNIFLSYLSGLKILYICRPSSILASMYTVH